MRAVGLSWNSRRSNRKDIRVFQTGVTYIIFYFPDKEKLGLMREFAKYVLPKFQFSTNLRDSPAECDGRVFETIPQQSFIECLSRFCSLLGRTIHLAVLGSISVSACMAHVCRT